MYFKILFTKSTFSAQPKKWRFWATGSEMLLKHFWKVSAQKYFTLSNFLTESYNPEALARKLTQAQEYPTGEWKKRHTQRR